MRVDFHCHSSISDGDLSPERLATAMRDAGVRCAALTDHDTADGQERFLKALRGQGIDGVSGAEIQVGSAEGPIHLLAYGFDLGETGLSRALWSLRHPILCAGREWLNRLGVRWNGRGRAAGGGGDSLACGTETLDVADALRLIRQANGRAFLAHPFTTTAEPARLEALVKGLAAAGLDGIEAHYKAYREDQQGALVDLAERHGLLVSGGSDFHGHGFPHDSGPGVDMPEADWARFRAAVDPMGAR